MGWIPFKNQSIQFDEEKGVATYLGNDFKTFYHRKIQGKIKTGCFAQDSLGNWFVNLVCEVEAEQANHSADAVGIDLGLKTVATLSDGYKIENPKFLDKSLEKLGKAQRHNKKQQVKKLHKKIKNQRKDFLHKESTKIVKKILNIFIGNVSGVFLQKTQGKSSADASVGLLRNLLKYKAIKHSGNFYEVVEKFTTLTCGACSERTGPQGLTGLNIREWGCSNCGAVHDRDVNAAQNILRFGHETLIVCESKQKGSPGLKAGEDVTGRLKQLDCQSTIV